VHCSHIDHVVDALIRNTHVRNIQRLRVYLPFHRPGKQLAELPSVDIRSIQDSLVQIRTAAAVVIVLGENTNLSPGRQRCQQTNDEIEGTE